MATDATDTRAEKIRLCSEALTLLNVASITSFEENSRGANMASLHYERIYRECLTRCRWSFTRVFRYLVPDASYHPEPNKMPFSYRFVLPEDFVNLIGVIAPNREQDPISMFYGFSMPQTMGRLDAYMVNYQMRDGFVYANCKSILLDYQYRVSEDNLTKYPLFRTYLVYSLARDFATAVAGKEELYQMWSEKADQAYGLASSTDTNSNPMESTNYSTTLAHMRSFG